MALRIFLNTATPGWLPRLLRCSPLVFALTLTVELSAQQSPPPDFSDPERGAAPAPTDSRNHALLVATDTYSHWQPLKRPIADIKKIAAELDEFYGFAVDLLYNPTQIELLLRLRHYRRKQFGRTDQLLIMFAGHGYFDDDFKTGYIAVKDSKTPEQDPSLASLIPYPLLWTINHIPAEHILVIADACFSGAIDPGTRGDYENTSIRALSRRMTLKTRRYITSGGMEYVPDASHFADALLEGLRSYGGRDGILSIDELIADYLHDLSPLPRWGSFRGNEPGSTFLFTVRRLEPPTGDIPLPVTRAARYCRAGGANNIRKGLQIVRDFVEGLDAGRRDHLDSRLLETADREYRAGSLAVACGRYVALYRDESGSRNH